MLAEFLDDEHMKAVKLSNLSIGILYLPGYHWFSFLLEAVSITGS